MKYKIYLLENTKNNKKYVGYTAQSLNKRFYQHSRSNKPIGKAMRLYGKDCFTVKMIDECDILDDALSLEQKWILHYHSFGEGYNCTKGGDCSPIRRTTNSHKTVEFSNKMKKNALKQHSDPITKKNHIEGIKTFWNSLSEEEKDRRRQIAIQNGKKSKVAWNKGLSFPGTGMAGEKNPMAKKYRVWYPDGTEIVVNCLSSFCKDNGLTYRNACGVVEGKQRHHKGFRFARLENHS